MNSPQELAYYISIPIELFFYDYTEQFEPHLDQFHKITNGYEGYRDRMCQMHWNINAIKALCIFSTPYETISAQICHICHICLMPSESTPLNKLAVADAAWARMPVDSLNMTLA